MTKRQTEGRRPWLVLLTLLTAGALLLTVSPSASAGKERDLGELRVLDDRSDREHDRVVTCDFWIAGIDMPKDEGELVVKRVSDGEKVIEEEWEANQNGNFITGPHVLEPGTYEAFAFAKHENTVEAETVRKPVAEPVTFIVEECEPEPLACPTDLQARALDNGDIFLRWDPAEGSEGSRVYRSEGDQDPVLVAELEGENDTFIDTETVPGTTYTYGVRGVFEDGVESSPCPTIQVTAIPVFPTVLGALAASTVGVLAYAGLRRRL